MDQGGRPGCHPEVMRRRRRLAGGPSLDAYSRLGQAGRIGSRHNSWNWRSGGVCGATHVSLATRARARSIRAWPLRFRMVPTGPGREDRPAARSTDDPFVQRETRRMAGAPPHQDELSAIRPLGSGGHPAKGPDNRRIRPPEGPGPRLGRGSVDRSAGPSRPGGGVGRSREPSVRASGQPKSGLRFPDPRPPTPIGSRPLEGASRAAPGSLPGGPVVVPKLHSALYSPRRCR